MEVNGEPHNLATLALGKEPTVPTEEGAWWAMQ